MPKRRLVGVLAATLVAALTLLAPAARADDAWLGVALQELDDPLREALGLGDREGVLVSDVERDSPAATAGLEDGDVIVEIDGRAATSPRRVIRTLERADPGDEVEIVVLRDGERQTLTATLDGRDDWLDEWTPRGRGGIHVVPRAPRAPRAPHALHIPHAPEAVEPLMRFFGRPRLGVETRRLDESLAPYFGVAPGEGVLILDVMKDTPADDAELLPGDVILRVDGEAVDSPGDLRDLLLDLEGETVTLDVRRRNEEMSVEVTLDEAESIFSTGRGGRASVFQLPHDDTRELREELEALREELRELERELRESR